MTSTRSGSGDNIECISPPHFSKKLYDCAITVGWPGVLHIDVGLENLGGTSCINAALQILLHTPAFVMWLDADTEHRRICNGARCLTCAIASVRKEMLAYQESVSPVILISKLFDVFPSLKSTSDVDAFEFFFDLLVTLDAEFKNRDICLRNTEIDKWTHFTSPIFQIYGGFLKFEGECCGSTTGIYKSFLFLNLDETDGTDVQQCLTQSASNPDAGLSVSCCKCGGLFKWVKSHVHTYPHYLILKISRNNQMGDETAKRSINLNDGVKFGDEDVLYNFAATLMDFGASRATAAIVGCPESRFSLIADKKVKRISPLRIFSEFSSVWKLVMYSMTPNSKRTIITNCFSPAKKRKDVEAYHHNDMTLTATQGTWAVSPRPVPSSIISPAVQKLQSSLEPLPVKIVGPPSHSSDATMNNHRTLRSSGKRPALTLGKLKPRSLQWSSSIDSMELPSSFSTTIPSKASLFKEIGVQVNFPPINYTICRNSMDSKIFRFYTGLKQEQFDVVFRLLGGDAVMGHLKFHYNPATPLKSSQRTNISPPDRLFLTLIRLRRGIPMEDLAHVCGLSRGHVAEIVYTVVRHMSLTFRALEKEMFLTAQEQKKMKTEASRLFPNLRIILDGAHFRIQCPSNFHQQGNTFSLYKASNTVVFVIGVSCSGAIIFVSPGYEGNMSDKEIVLNSGLMQRLNKGDVVMADRGFDLTAEFQEIGVDLIKPPSLGKRKKFTAEEEIMTRNIASVRIMVEHAVRRIKEFRILRGEIPITLLPVLPDMVACCAYLSNF